MQNNLLKKIQSLQLIQKNKQVQQLCLVCYQNNSDLYSLPNCQHNYCFSCIKQFIQVLKTQNSFRPQKLICFIENCAEQLPQALINKIYPGEEGFVLNVVRKRYKQSKDPAIKIFNCKGFLKSNRQNLIIKDQKMTREEHTKFMNQKVKNILEGKQIVQDKKICTNIISYNKLNTKDKLIQCYICGVGYCSQCQQLGHDSKCEFKQSKNNSNRRNLQSKFIKLKQGNQQNLSIEAYIQANSMTQCLNPKCGLVIMKEQGCFWVKCRCSWEFCYPCKKLWGDCEHYDKYPYKKFIPPPQWMVKALNLY